MARDIVDDRMLGALHLQALDRDGFDHDPAVEHAAFQIGTLDALMAGRFDGDATVGELLAHGDHGLGTLQHLAGEMIVLDGEAWVVDGDGDVSRVPADTRTPFAVVCPFAPCESALVEGSMPQAALRNLIDDLAPVASGVVAYRVVGEVADLRLRSVRAQTPPYPPLTEVTAHQTEWRVGRATGTVVGFRFPDSAAGVEVPGHHAHFLADDRRTGGHLLDVTLLDGRIEVDGGDELHVELPEGVDLGVPGAADRAAIRSAEGG